MVTVRSISKSTVLLTIVALGFSLVCSRAAAQKQDSKAEESPESRRALTYYAHAADYQNSGAFELAIEEWEKLVKEFPKHAQASTAWHHLGVCNLQRKEPNYEQAIAAFSEALKDKDLDIREESLINLSWALLTQARLENEDAAKQRETLSRAKGSLEEFLKSYGDGAYADQALFYLGDIEHLLGNRRESIAYFKKLLTASSLAKSSLRPDAIYALSVAYEEEEQFSEAERWYKIFRDEFPEHRLTNEVGLRTADIMLRKGDLAGATELLTRLASSDHSMADYGLLRLGYALSQQGKSEEAVRQYEQLLKLYPDSKHAATAALSVGQSLFQAGKLDEAIARFQEVLSRDSPLSGDATHSLAMALIRQGRAAEAVPLLEKAIRDAGDKPIAIALQMDYADALYEDPTQLEKARLAYEQIANDNPDDALAPRAAYNAAFAALQCGKLKEVRQWSERFLALYPQDPLRSDVAYVAAEALLQQGEHEAATQAYTALLASDQQNPSVNLWKLRLGMANYLAGNYDATLKLLVPQVDQLSDDAQKAEALFLIGASHLYKEDTVKAVASLTSSHQTSDQWSGADEVLLMLAEAHQRNKDNTAARKTLEALLKKFPQSRFKPQVEYKLAQLSASNGDLDDAITRYRAIVKEQSAAGYHNFARYGIVWCLMQQNNYRDALTEAQPLLSQNLRDSIGNEALLAAGVCLRKLERRDEAIQTLNEFLKTNPSGQSLANGLYELGLAYTEDGKLELANQNLQRIVAEVPAYQSLDKVLYELAWNSQDAGQSDQALNYFQKLAKSYPESDYSSEANYMLAQKQYDDKQYDQAAATYASVMADTQDTELKEKAQYKLGWSLFQQEKYPQAAKEFSAQSGSYPEGSLAVDGLFMQGECAFKQDDFAGALASYSKARERLEAAPRDSEASAQVRALIYLHGGQCHRELSNWQECENWLRVVVDRHSDSAYLPVALYELGYCKQKQGKIQEALTHYEEVASNYRTEVGARSRFMMGEVYFAERDFAKAIKEFQRVMFGFGGDKAPEDIKNWQAKSAFEAARCSEVLIEKLGGATRKQVVDTAQEFYEFIVEKHATHELASQAQSRLGELRKLR